MIINRFDYRMVKEQEGHGVGFQILEDGSYNRSEIDLTSSLLELRQKYLGDCLDRGNCDAKQKNAPSAKSR